MAQNCESNFDHCNKMSNVLMPRDFLAKLTGYFVRDSDDTLTFFQKAHLEACEIMSSRRPHWRKRKSKSAALFISTFFLIEKEVEESEDSLEKELFVEIFNNRDTYIDVLMAAMDRIDEIEDLMKEGCPMELPVWDEETCSVQNAENLSSADNGGCDVDNIVQETLEVIKGLSDLDKSKYVKVFTTKERPPMIAIQHNKVKS